MQIAEVNCQRTLSDESPKLARRQRTAAKRLLGWARVKYVAINLFLAAHVVAVSIWCIPLHTPIVPICRNLLRPYFLWFGLFQSWDMFCPTPKSSNSYIEAIVIYADGAEKSWTFPRMEQLSLTQRYIKERYRKFGEKLPLEQNDVIWADIARHIAHANSTPSNPVKMVDGDDLKRVLDRIRRVNFSANGLALEIASRRNLRPCANEPNK